MSAAPPNVDVLERMVRAVEKVRERLLRASKALEDAGVRYAVIGVGLVTERDLADLPDLLAARLRELLENPDG
ncbi:MAG: hypothetical protein FJ290_30540 [Planctomycetes bacterium]|nr:hypothetical protein [Planctomycetota bacterium]